MIQAQLTPVILDKEGTFKYILIRREDNGNFSYFVRGFNQYEYHAENFKHFNKELTNITHGKDHKFDKNAGIIQLEQGIIYRCVGGGRVEHSNKNQKIFIYGYSQSYGQADHKITKQLIEEHLKYPAENVTWSNEGY